MTKILMTLTTLALFTGYAVLALNTMSYEQIVQACKNQNKTSFNQCLITATE